jgi:hypothetical protein
VLECGVRGVHSSWAFLHGLVRRRDDRDAAAVEAAAGAAACSGGGAGHGASARPLSHGSCPAAAAAAAASAAAEPLVEPLVEPFIVQNDLDDCYSPQFAAAAARAGVPLRFHWKDDLTLDLPRDLGPPSRAAGSATASRASGASGTAASKNDATLAGPQSVGLVFIDTLHVYGQVCNRPRVHRPICSYRLSMCIFLRPRD